MPFTRFRLVVAGCALAVLLPGCQRKHAGTSPGPASDPGASVDTFDLDMKSDSVDPNGFPINPYWVMQRRDSMMQRPGLRHYDPYPAVNERCGNFNRWRATGDDFLSGCTSQVSAVTFQRAPWYVPNGICAFHDTLPNHVNWRFGNGIPQRSATTAVGRVYFRDLASDGDVDLFLRTPGDPGRSRGDPGVKLPADSALGLRLTELEFHLGEVRQHIRRKSWWGNLIAGMGEAEQRRDEKHPGRSLNGLAAVVIGVFGVDGVHKAHSELHPVFAIAVRVQSDSLRETWEVFARNWGSEGMCSEDSEVLELPGDSLILWIPWRAGATGATVSWSGSSSHVPQTSVLRPIAISIPLQPPRRRRVVDGTLKVTWKGPVVPDTLRSEPALAWEERLTDEDKVEEAIRKLSRRDQAAVDREVEAVKNQERELAKQPASPGGSAFTEEELARIEARGDSAKLVLVCRLSPRIRRSGTCTPARPPDRTP